MTRLTIVATVFLITSKHMQTDEFLLDLQIESLEEGGFLATSKDLPGLVAQGRTRAETMEIARDVARKLVESFIEHGDELPQQA